jgi:tetratricopeptide (TPR) repeat protein
VEPAEQMTRHFVGVPPMRSGGLLGRGDLLTRAVDLLLLDDDVAFAGVGGVGKSALASALVRDHAVRVRFGGGVFWLSVGRTEAGTPAWRLQLIDWARALDMPQDRIAAAERTGTESLLSLIHHGFGAARMLLVFDDVWEESDALMFKDLGADCRRILTTRIGSVASAFSASGFLPVDDLPDAAARELFDRLAPVVAQRRPETASLCISAVGRLPLVLVIVASYLQARVMDDPTRFDEALGEVLDVRTRLNLAPPLSRSSLTRLPEGVTATLDAVIGLSAAWLSPEDHHALTSLAAFPPKLNSFSWEAARAVAESRESVVTLRRYSLVEDLAGELRLTMHQTIHDYAIRGTGGDPEAYRRMADYFLTFISEQQDSAVDTETWLRALELEKDNIGVALEWAMDYGETLLAYRLMSALWEFWYRRSRYARAKELADRILALDLADSTEDSFLLRAKVLNDTGNFAYNMADLEQAERRHLEALKIRDALDHDTVAGSWNNLSLVYRERGRYDEADFLLNKALKRNRDVGNDYWEALNLGNLGINARCLGDLNASEAYLRNAASIFANKGDRWGQAMTHIDLALTLVGQDRLVEARELLVGTLADRWRVEDQKLSAAALRGLAAVSSAECRPELSLNFLLASLALSVPILDRLGEHQCLMALVSAYGDQHDHQRVARLSGILTTLRASTGLNASPLTERATAHALSDALATLSDTFGTLADEGHAAAIAKDGVLDVENSVQPLLRDIDIEAVITGATAEA